MKIRRTSAVFLAGLFVFTLGAASAEDEYKTDRRTKVSDSTISSVQSEGFSLTSKDAAPTGAKARPLGELELAIQEYLLYFDAYRQAQQSTVPAERAKASQLLRTYRNAYAKALKMLRDDKLIHPMIPQNPLKLYMETAESALLGDPKKRKRFYDEVKKAAKDALKHGKNADEIVAIIKNKIEILNQNWQQSSSSSSSPGSIFPPGLPSPGQFPSPGQLPPPGVNPPGQFPPPGQNPPPGQFVPLSSQNQPPGQNLPGLNMMPGQYPPPGGPGYSPNPQQP
ncbi:MAG TPA: hypothetical protein PLU72_02170 [Candidatus Ozemobacteraceae bacterium]|nr:hypothetical protein [Candidatus Ozemobacteraceae bacterium]HQG26948.1 hypothetical protein [Candidatus Ozemobacteraceae bacterium]